MNKASYRKYKKKGKYTKRKNYRLRKRTLKYSGGDILFNLQQLTGIFNTNPPHSSPHPFLQ